MPTDATPGQPPTRHYSPEENAAAVRLARTLRAELGAEHGTVQWVSRGCVRRELSARPPPRAPDSATGLSPRHSCLTGCMVNS